jgi:hypothetical protein
MITASATFLTKLGLSKQIGSLLGPHMSCTWGVIESKVVSLQIVSKECFPIFIHLSTHKKMATFTAHTGINI